MTLEDFCAVFLGSRADLSTRVIAATRPSLAGSNALQGGTDKSERRFDSFLRKEGLTRPRLRQISPRIDDYTNWRDYTPVKRSDVEDELYESWLEATNEYGCGHLNRAAGTALEIKARLQSASRSFAKRLGIHCDALLVDVAAASDRQTLRLSLSESRRITARYLAQRDRLSAGISLLSEAQLNRALALFEPERSTVLRCEALRLVNAASDAFSEYRPQRDPDTLLLVRHVALFQRSRLLQELACLDKAASELPRLRESALTIGNGSALIEYTRAASSLYMLKGRIDESRQEIANGCWLYDHSGRRPGIAMVSLLGRMLTWCRVNNRRIYPEDLDAFSDYRSGDAPDEYTSDWRSRIKRIYKNGVHWDNVCGPACYAVRRSSIYLTPKLSRM